MTTLTAASNQWMTRPDDQRFLDLESLLAAVDSRRQASVTRTMTLAGLEAAGTEQNEIVLHGKGLTPTAFTNWSFGQFASIAGAPAKYLRGLPAPLAAANLEYGLMFGDEARKDAKLLYVEGDQYAEMRATTGPNYGRIWDAQIVRAMMAADPERKWTVPTPFKTAGQAYTGPAFEVDKRSTTLYASDRDIFLFLVREDLPIEVDGQQFFRGFYCWNSEVGKATFGLASFIYSYVCANRMIWGAQDFEELRIRHTSMAPERFIAQAVPAINAIAERSPEPIVAAIKKAKDTYVGKTAGDVEQWLAAKGMTTFESKVAMSLAAQGGDTGSSGNPSNLWDLVQGGTAYARGIGQQDDRLDVEKRWSGLLRYAGKVTPQLAADELAALPSAN